MPRPYTIEEKKVMLKLIADSIRDSLTSFIEVCRKHNTCWLSVKNWQEKDDGTLDEYFEDIRIARQIRAAAYVEEGRRILDECKVFYNVREGVTYTNVKDSMASVNKAKFQCDMRFKLAEALDPENWSSLRDEIKRIYTEITDLKNAVKTLSK